VDNTQRFAPIQVLGEKERFVFCHVGETGLEVMEWCSGVVLVEWWWWNGGGTVVERWWNGGGTVVERWWNGGGTVVERWWNGVVNGGVGVVVVE
jgi:hypothetical protein